MEISENSPSLTIVATRSVHWRIQLSTGGHFSKTQGKGFVVEAAKRHNLLAHLSAAGEVRETKLRYPFHFGTQIYCHYEYKEKQRKAGRQSQDWNH